MTLEGETRPARAPPFLVLATQNPIEYEGTYPLPEAQLDRFLLRIGVGYPTREDEWEMLERRLERSDGRGRARAGRQTARRVLELQRAVEEVHVSESVGLYMVDIVAATRDELRASRSARARAARSRC